MNASAEHEKWRPIPGAALNYEVSDHGRVRRGNRILKTRSDDKWGYVRISLRMREGVRKMRVHRLVLMAFVGPCPDGRECCHKDGNPANNHVSNLYWGTKSDNIRDCIRHGNHCSVRKTHCANGHEFNAENTFPRPTGGRDCRVCRRERSRELMRHRRARLREAV